MRALRARPAFATLIVCCLAIGIGANIAMFSIANVLFLRPPTGIRNADALMRLYVVRRSGETQSPQGGAFSYPDFADLRQAQQVFAGVAASHPASFTVGHGADAETVQGEFASADYFRVLGTRTAHGRFFTADEDSVRGLHPAEVGIRMALGSTALAAVALMARQGAKPVAIGLVAGLVGAVAVTRFLQHLLYNVSPTDGPSFAAAAALLGLVAAVACIVPARKAAQVDPVVALRAE
ncbi:MAG TPA: ABC transporter permease [Gemmatimonadaceae bacterium]|nr:ABC transporter permease [Gemmatimonadaceae bacterium]